MGVVDKLSMIMVAVDDMPRAKEFYADKLGMKVGTEFRRDDANWWASVMAEEGGVAITLSTYHDHMKPGTMTLYFTAPDITVAHKELSDKGVKVNEIKDDLHGPGSGVKWFNFEDPDGNRLFIEQE